MSDEPPAVSAPEELPAEPSTEPTPVAEPPAKRRRLLPWLTAAGFIILAAAIAWVWQFPAIPPPSTEATNALEQQIDALQARVNRLEQRPEQQIPDLAPLTARVSALEHQPAGQTSTTAIQSPDVGPLEARIAALEQRQPADLAPLEARVAALEQRQPDLQPLETRLAALEAKQQRSETNLSGQIAALQSGENAMRADLSRQANLASSSAKRAARAQSAALAMAAGQKLGDLPDAPPALSRYADTNPPTLASLRLAFPAAAREALGVARPDTEGKPFMARLWAQAQDLVTIRQGEKVLVGDPAAEALERAQDALNAGDLAAAVAALGSLQGTAAQAMAGWVNQAKALLAANAALAAWAATD